MRSYALAFLVFAVVAGCGGDAPPPAEPQPTAPKAVENQPPVIRAVQISPREPEVGDSLTLGIKVNDPENDAIDLDIAWFRNGQAHSSGRSATLDTSTFTRGDRIHAVVTASDGRATSEVQADPVIVVNRAPEVVGLQILPEAPTSSTPLTVVAEARDADGDDFELAYRWFVKGDEVRAAKGPTLGPEHFHRGDKIRVEVIPSDRDAEGDAIRSAVLQIPNATPEIESDPATATVSGGRYKYAIRAVDPDGDRPLRYSLVEGPDGMSVDLISGVVTWTVPDNAGGRYPVEIAVSDPLGGEVRQKFDVELRWESEPANEE